MHATAKAKNEINLRDLFITGKKEETRRRLVTFHSTLYKSMCRIARWKKSISFPYQLWPLNEILIGRLSLHGLGAGIRTCCIWGAWA